MIFNKTERQERCYLQKILNLIKETLINAEGSVADHVNTLREYKEYLWENKDLDPQEIRSMRESILAHYAIGENEIARRARLTRMMDIPYFGRIDFTPGEQSGSCMPIYIGIHSLYDPSGSKLLIYDWRAPVSGMYYDHETGNAWYVSQEGTVSGNISLKRQYRVRKGQMDYMLESSLTIGDDVLQKELSMNADEKMRNIVATIQREQNLIIRNLNAQTLIIQGAAGSGKTSVALHRVAFLLYAQRERLGARNILIVSPNKVFSDYISGVLPELGEETVPESGMEKIVSNVLGNRYRFQTFFEQVTELLDKPRQAFIDRIKFKASAEFTVLLDNYIIHLENNGFRGKDMVLNGYFPIPAGYIEEQFRRFDRYPVNRRFDVMTDYILETARIKYRIDVPAERRNKIRKEIRGMFCRNNLLDIYKDFFEWAGCPHMFGLRKNRTLEYPDLAPLAYLHLALEGTHENSQVKHLLIDEMQDYTPIQYKLIQKLFPCRKTILGDAGQSVNPYGSSTAEMILKACTGGEIMKLCKSYRSTCEITRFAQRIRPDRETQAIERHGEVPVIAEYDLPGDERNAIAHMLKEFSTSGNSSLGIICRGEQEARALYDFLKEHNNSVALVLPGSTSFTTGITVTSAHMAKGLEFDEVIVPHAGRNNYKTDMDRSMLYIAVTRAMHKLTLTCTGSLTRLVGPDLSDAGVLSHQ